MGLALSLCLSLLISWEAGAGNICWSGLTATQQTEIICSRSPPFHKASGTWAYCSEWASIIHSGCQCDIDNKANLTLEEPVEVTSNYASSAYGHSASSLVLCWKASPRVRKELGRSLASFPPCSWFSEAVKMMFYFLLDDIFRDFPPPSQNFPIVKEVFLRSDQVLFHISSWGIQTTGTFQGM